MSLQGSDQPQPVDFNDPCHCETNARSLCISASAAKSLSFAIRQSSQVALPSVTGLSQGTAYPVLCGPPLLDRMPASDDLNSQIESLESPARTTNMTDHTIIENMERMSLASHLTLKDILLSNDDPPDQLQDLLLHRLSTSSEVTLFVNDQSLHAESHDWAALVEPPESVAKETCTLTTDQTHAIVRTLSQSVSIIGGNLGVLFDPAKDRDQLQVPDRNDPDVDQRWSAKGLRLLVRHQGLAVEDIQELRVAVCGNVDAGKSTLLGVLTKGFLDDGRGRARVALMRHKHEIETGRTSSVGLEILGFDSKSEEIMPDGLGTGLPEPGFRRQQFSWDQIASKASKIVSFIDLAGHEKYLKTTIFGLTGSQPDFVMLVIGANAGLIGMSKEHLAVALALHVPVICVVTKTDMTPPLIQAQTRKQLVKILKSPGCRKTPVYVRDKGMAVELARHLTKKGERIAPIFEVSNVEGQGLEQLKSFLNALPSCKATGQYEIDKPFEFSISEVFSVPFVGAVASGTVLTGAVRVNDTVLLGPDGLGQWKLTAIKSIHRKRVTVTRAEAGQSVCFALKKVKASELRKGMVLVGSTASPRAVMRFCAEILVLYHNSTISKKYQAMLHVASSRQTVRILDISEKDVLRTGDRATVTMEFMTRPEAIKEGQTVLFREGRTKGLGVVTKCL